MKFSSFQKADIPGLPFAIDISNDGTLLACATQSNDQLAHAIRVLRTSDGTLITSFMQASVVNGRGVTFLDSTNDLAFLFQRAGDSTQLLRASLGSRNPIELESYPASVATHAIVRDQHGARFAVLGRQADVWDATSNHRLLIVPGANADQPVHATFSPDGMRLYAYGTLEGRVACYDVGTGNLTDSWEAPTPFGAQVVVTPDERYLIAAAEAHRGFFLYDLTNNKRISPPPEAEQMFGRESQWRPWISSQDGRHLMCLKARLRAFDIPSLQDVSPPERITPPSTRCWVAVSARSAPVVAFGTAEDAMVRWASYQPDL